MFIKTAKKLAMARKDFHFHIVGGFDGTELDIRELEGRISFYGCRDTGFLHNFYSRMDIILSPNIPFVRAPGAFDGFPTAGCVEAGLCGVAVFCTDPLSLNPGFVNGHDIVIISSEPEEICEQIMNYACDYGRLKTLATNGQAAFRKVFNLESQVAPRIRILRE